MTETQRRIKELKRALPNMKEKVVAVAVLLALSLTMMASVSFAWYTMSFAPELAGVNTTVAANGSLEVALSDYDGSEPKASVVGDSFSAENQTMHNANISWGNLVNLTSNYGIESLVLRPATFTPQSPVFLSSMKYGDDGRVEGTTTDFAFTTWTLLDEGTQSFDFSVAKDSAFGVRAISSVGYDESMGKSIMLLKMEQARNVLLVSTDKYETIYDGQTEGGKKYVDVIRDVVNVYLNYYTYKALDSRGMSGMAGMLGVTNDSEITAHMDDLVEIFTVFHEAIVLYGDALDFLTGVQTEMGVAANKVNLGTAKTKHNTLEANVLKDLNLLKEYAEYEKVTFADNPEVLSIVNRLIDIDSSIINGGGIENKSVSALMASMSEAVDIVLNMKEGTELTVLVTKGNLKTFEELHGVKRSMRLENMKLAGKRVHGTMSTNASGSLYEEAINKTQSLDTSYLNSMVAEDTYGMVIDLWFRTNSPDGTLLALDGTVKTETRYKDRMIILTGESKSRNVYYYNRPTGVVVSGMELTEEVLVFKGEEGDTNFEVGSYYDIYTYAKAYNGNVVQVEKTDENGNVVTDDSGNTVYENVVVDDTEKPITDSDVSIKKDSYEVVIGFESSNRYDGDYTFTEGSEISATQGSGSCFVFYADTPEDSAAAMEMLGQLKLAFMDADNNLLAKAIMDVEHVFAESGKYTVPIVITETETMVTDESTGKTIYGITAMQQNVAKRISVVLYLEGEGLENSMAFSDGLITGSLNFQFSTSEDLNALKNTDLADQIISLTAGLNKTSFEMYDGTVQTAKLTATIDGLSAKKVEAIFQRKINATQGTRMTPVTLTQEGTTNNWSGECSFVLPGTYELSSLWIDGVEYKLPNKISITMPGFAVTAVKFCETSDEKVVLTAENSVTRDVSVMFSAGQQPDKVEVRLQGEDGNYVSASLMQDESGWWNGTARFDSSGTYTLKYVVVSMLKPEPNPDKEYDVAYYELEDGLDEEGNPDENTPNFQKTFTAFLGLRAEVKFNQSANDIRFEYYGPETEAISVRILTDNGTELRAMKNVKLYYGKRGSGLDANGLQADLSWTNGEYAGEFNVNKVGVFNFTKLEVDGNLITIATVAPSITAISLEPPAYESSEIMFGTNVSDTQLLIVTNPDTKIYYAAKIAEASAAEITAVFTRSDGNDTAETVLMSPTYFGEGAANSPNLGEDYYYFEIPKTKNNNRNGIWTVTQLRFADVYDENGKEYTAEDPYLQTVGYEFVVVEQSVTVDTRTFGNTSSAAFMTSYPLRKANAAGTGYDYEYGATITYAGIDLASVGLEISNVKLTLTHQGDNATYGGYTYDTTDSAVVTKMAAYRNFEYNLTQNSAGKWIVSDADAAVQLAGTYNYVLTYKLTGVGLAADVSYSYSGTGIRVESVKPSVSITSISPSGTHTSLKVTSAVTADQVSVESKIEGNTATVYQKATKTGKWYNPEYTLVEEPKVTLGLSNMGAATGASMTFTTEANSGTVYMYTGATHTGQTAAFTWTPTAQTCMRYIGYNDAGSCNETKVAGTLKSSAVVLTFDSVYFNVAVDEITIINVQPT